MTYHNGLILCLTVASLRRLYRYNTTKPEASRRLSRAAALRLEASRSTGPLLSHEAPRNTRLFISALYQSSHHCHTLPPMSCKPLKFASKLPTGLVRGKPSL